LEIVNFVWFISSNCGPNIQNYCYKLKTMSEIGLGFDVSVSLCEDVMDGVASKENYIQWYMIGYSENKLP
jgi:hypothetical protein